MTGTAWPSAMLVEEEAVVCIAWPPAVVVEDEAEAVEKRSLALCHLHGLVLRHGGNPHGFQRAKRRTKFGFGLGSSPDEFPAFFRIC